MRQKGSNGRQRELRFFRSIHAASPQVHVRIRNIGNPLVIRRKLEHIGGDAIQVRLEATRFRVVADGLQAEFLSHDKELFPINTRDRRAEAKRSGNEARRLSYTARKKVAVLGHDPDGLIISLARLKEVVIAIRGPVSAALKRGLSPFRQERMKIAAVCLYFPQGTGGSPAPNVETDPFAVRRVTKPTHGSQQSVDSPDLGQFGRDLCQLTRVAAVSIDREQRLPIRIEDLRPVRRITGG